MSEHDRRRIEADVAGPQPVSAAQDAAFIKGAVAALDNASSAERKTMPIVTGCIDYFPDALAYVAHVSYMATQQHHPGEPMHWDRNKSMDHADCAGRHLAQRGTMDADKVLHTGKLAWRALALLQLELEAISGKKTS